MELYGTIFIIVLGCIGHFLFEWSNHNKLVGYLFAINESTWEHIKLIIGPFIIWMTIEIPFIGNKPNFIFSRTVALLSMIVIMPLLFYVCKYIFKGTSIPRDILIFIISIIIGEYLGHIFIQLPNSSFIVNYLSIIILIIIYSSYLMFSYSPLKIFLFKDPITNKYGMDAHYEIDKLHLHKHKK